MDPCRLSFLALACLACHLFDLCDLVVGVEEMPRSENHLLNQLQEATEEAMHLGSDSVVGVWISPDAASGLSP